MKTNLEDFKNRGELIRDTNVYSIYDLKYLDHLNVSITILHPEKETSGHEHAEADEVYIFLEGTGKIKVGDEISEVKKGDWILIKGGKFHKVFNMGNKDLIFLCIFEKYGGRGK